MIVIDSQFFWQYSSNNDVRGEKRRLSKAFFEAWIEGWQRCLNWLLFVSAPEEKVKLYYTFFFHLLALQIHNQFPCSFEFTEKFLVTLADHSYFSNFGTFLCDSEFERNLMGVKEHTVSLWSYLNRPEILSNYLNCLYEPNSKVIWPSVAPVSLVRT